MDGAILLIAADDGPMPQTREHLLLAKQVGIKKVVIFINKADLVDTEMLELVDLETLELLEEYGFDSDKTPIIHGSAKLALQGESSQYGEPSIVKLLSALDTYIDIPKRDIESPFSMPIDNILSVKGRGTVVVGTVKQGVIRKKDPAQGKYLQILITKNLTKIISVSRFGNTANFIFSKVIGFGMNKKTTISDMQVFKKSVPMAEAGDNVGINIKNISVESMKKGMVLVKVDSMEPTNHFEGTTYFLTKVTETLYSLVSNTPSMLFRLKFMTMAYPFPRGLEIYNIS